MSKAEDNKEGIADALKAMFKAAESEDWDTAAEEFSTAQDLADDDSDEPAEGDDGEDKPNDGKNGKGLLMAVFGKPKEK